MRKSVSLLLIVLIFLSFFSKSAFGEALIESEFPQSLIQPNDIPPYSEDSNYYYDINDGLPNFAVWQHTTIPFVIFSPLDSYGRTGAAYACLGPETLPTEPRGQIGNVHPAGWQSTRYEGIIDGDYLYNRSHLIGYLLCGDTGTAENLFTGTRNLNAKSMALVETAIEMFIQETGFHVLYRVTPFYHGEDLVPFGVQIEALSMETDEEGICCNLFLYNVQPGIEIDYATGDSKKASKIISIDNPEDSVNCAIKTIPREIPEDPPEPAAISVTYVLNNNTHKFHNPDCPSVSDIKAKNRQDVDWPREIIIAAGYRPSGCCNP